MAEIVCALVLGKDRNILNLNDGEWYDIDYCPIPSAEAMASPMPPYLLMRS